MIKGIHQRFKDDLKDMVFGRLIAKYISKIDAEKRAYWHCECTCGNTKDVRRDSLLDGTVKSCGCLQYDAVRKLSKPVKFRAIRSLFNRYKSSAKKRGLEFSLLPEQIESIVSLPCVYCGSTPDNVYTRTKIGDKFQYSGIDRLDNSIGYIFENCVSCCWDCNQSKHSKSKEEFLSWIKRVYEFNHLENS